MLPEEIFDLLRRQHGLVADRQVCEIARNPAARRRIHRDPDLERVGPRVARHRATTPTVEQGLMHAVLDAGPDGALWSKTGAALWGFGPFRLTPAHVALRRGSGGKGERIAQIHTVRDLEDSSITTASDLPVARPEETVLWLCGMWTHRLGHELAEARMKRTLDQAWRDELIDGEVIHELAARSGGRGRSGIVVLRSLLETRPPDYQPSGSGLEDRFEEIVPAEVLDVLDRQVTVDGERKIRVVDYRCRAWPLIAEINGFGHSSFTEREDDEERYERVLELGFSVVVWWAHDIWHDQLTVRDTMLHLIRNPDPVPTLHRPTPAPWQPGDSGGQIGP